jgi:hypothetical protein
VSDTVADGVWYRRRDAHGKVPGCQGKPGCDQPRAKADTGMQWTLFAGLVIRLAGVAFMLRSRGAHGTPAELVANQVLQGLGGGLACVALQVSAQADVVHAGE